MPSGIYVIGQQNTPSLRAGMEEDPCRSRGATFNQTTINERGERTALYKFSAEDKGLHQRPALPTCTNNGPCSGQSIKRGTGRMTMKRGETRRNDGPRAEAPIPHLTVCYRPSRAHPGVAFAMQYDTAIPTNDQELIIFYAHQSNDRLKADAGDLIQCR